MDNPLNNENNPAVMNTANELQPTKEQLLEERKRFLIQEKKRKEEEERNARKEKALKSMQYLLAVSEKLSNFVKQQIIAAEKGYVNLSVKLHFISYTFLQGLGLCIFFFLFFLSQLFLLTFLKIIAGLNFFQIL